MLDGRLSEIDVCENMGVTNGLCDALVYMLFTYMIWRQVQWVRWLWEHAMSQMVFDMRLCVCSSCRCIGGKSQATCFGGNVSVTIGLWCSCLGCMWDLGVTNGLCDMFVWVCALHVDAMVKSWMRQYVCTNMDVTNGLCDVVDVLSVDALMEDIMR